MSYGPNQMYPGATELDPNYPKDKFKDNNPSTTNNGTPLKAIKENQDLTLETAVMNDAGFEYSGVADTPQDSQLFKAYKASLGNGANLLSNHNFLIQTQDDSQPLPSATPTSYPPGYQIFSGVFANETTGITNLTYINGRVSFSGGDLYFAVPNTGGIERLTSDQLTASVADFDGKPRTRGVSFALVGDEYRVTVGIDALEDVAANPTPLGSVKFEQGGVATGHGSQILQGLEGYGIVFEDQAFAESNYSKVISLVNGGFSIVIDKDIYLKPIGSLLSRDVRIETLNGSKINWTASGVAFRLANGVSYSDRGSSHVVPAGLSVEAVVMENPDGKVGNVYFEKFNVDGVFKFAFKTDQSKNPLVDDYGLEKVVFQDGSCVNGDGALLSIDSMPYKSVNIENVHAKSHKGLLVANPVQNGHPHYDDVQESMQHLSITNTTLINERGFFCDPTSGFYAGIALWEGNKLTFDKTTCSGVVSSGSVNVYDVYLAGISADVTNNEEIDCWQFNDNGNAGLKIKKAENVSASNKRKWFSSDFFDYYENNHGLLLSSSSGNPITVDYTDASFGGKYIMDNLYIQIPRCSDDGRSKAGQRMAHVELKNSTIAIDSGDEPYLLVPRWGDDMGDVDKNIIMVNNTLKLKQAEHFYICKLLIDDNTPDGGIINISGNTIVSDAGIFEILITNDENNSISTTLDLLEVSNKIYTDGTYQQIKDFCKLPTIRKTNFEGSLLQTTSSGTVTFGSNSMGGGNSSGSYKAVYSNQPALQTRVISLHNPTTSSVSQGYYYLKGDAQYDKTKESFFGWIYIDPEVSGAGTIDYTIKVLGATESTFTWNGSSSTFQTIDIGLGVSSPFRLLVRRTSDYMYLSFEWQSGQEPTSAVINWDYSFI